jgi:hypothetical protein
MCRPGYVATINPDPAQGVSNAAFWNGAVTINPSAENPNRIQYVIHRMCKEEGAYNAATNNCVQTAARQKAAGQDARSATACLPMRRPTRASRSCTM